MLSATGLAERAGLEMPTVSKLLKPLAQAGLVESFRGINGGYRLARAPGASPDRHRQRDGRPDRHDRMQRARRRMRHEPHCGVRVNWRRINQAIADALRSVSLADMVNPPSPQSASPISSRGWRRLTHEQRTIDTTRLSKTQKSSNSSAVATTPASSPTSNPRRSPPGLNEDVVRAISARKNEPEWMTEWRLAAYRHWLTMTVPHWAKLDIEPIDFQAISYFSRAEDQAEVARRGRSAGTARNLRQTRRAAARARASSPASRSMRCSIRFPSAPHSARNWPKQA